MSNIAILLPFWILGLPLAGALIEAIRAWGDRAPSHAHARATANAARYPQQA